jgi:mutual gliding-motility protein MglA
MVLCNYATMTVTAKIVYYGPGLGGKTTNLNYIYRRTSRELRGEMISLNTETERTLFFDLLPIAAGPIGDFKAQVQLYTVPGQIFYKPMRKIVLEGADGLVFVADSQPSMRESNRESFNDLLANLKALGLSLEEIPLVIQYNKRDLGGVLSVDEMNAALNPQRKYPWYEASALNGQGVFATLEAISKLSFRALRRRLLGERTAAATGSLAGPATPTPASPAVPSDGQLAGTRAPVAARAATAPAPTQTPVPAPTPVPALNRAAAPLAARTPAPEPARAPAPAPRPEGWEITFEETATSSRRPKVEEVRVRFDLDVNAELEKLQRQVKGGKAPAPITPPVPRPAPPSPAPAPAPGPPRELSRRFDLEVPRQDLKRLRRVVLSLRPEDASRKSLGPSQEYALDLEEADLEGLLLALKIQLKGR